MRTAAIAAGFRVAAFGIRHRCRSLLLFLKSLCLVPAFGSSFLGQSLQARERSKRRVFRTFTGRAGAGGLVPICTALRAYTPAILSTEPFHWLRQQDLFSNDSRKIQKVVCVIAHDEVAILQLHAFFVIEIRTKLGFRKEEEVEFLIDDARRLAQASRAQLEYFGLEVAADMDACAFASFDVGLERNALRQPNVLRSRIFALQAEASARNQLVEVEPALRDFRNLDWDHGVCEFIATLTSGSWGQRQPRRPAISVPRSVLEEPRLPQFESRSALREGPLDSDTRRALLQEVKATVQELRSRVFL